MRYTCRIPLNDILRSELESDVVKTLRMVAEECSQNVFIKFWCSKATRPTVIEEFVKKYESDLEYIGVNIHVGEEEHWQQKSMFEIRSIRNKNESSYRHFHIYDSLDQLIVGIIVFKRFVKESELKDKFASKSVFQKTPDVTVDRPYKKSKYKITHRRIDGSKK